MHIDQQIAKRLISAETARVAEEISLNQARGLLNLAASHKVLDLLDVLRATRQISGEIGRPAGPESVLIELNMFLADAAEDHPAQAAVANGQSFSHPCLSRL